MLAETIQKFKAIYAEKRETIEYMIQHGNEFEKAEATIIKNVAVNF